MPIKSRGNDGTCNWPAHPWVAYAACRLHLLHSTAHKLHPGRFYCITTTSHAASAWHMLPARGLWVVQAIAGMRTLYLGCSCHNWTAHAEAGLQHAATGLHVLHLDCIVHLACRECDSCKCNTCTAPGLHMLQLDCIFLRLSCISCSCSARDQKSKALHALDSTC